MSLNTPASEVRRKTCLIAFTEEEWHLWDDISDEEYVVPLIKKYLRTPEQRAYLAAEDFSIEDMLNGRVEGDAQQNFVALTYLDWNAKLGYKCFGN